MDGVDGMTATRDGVGVGVVPRAGIVGQGWGGCQGGGKGQGRGRRWRMGAVARNRASHGAIQRILDHCMDRSATTAARLIAPIRQSFHRHAKFDRLRRCMRHRHPRSLLRRSTQPANTHHSNKQKSGDRGQGTGDKSLRESPGKAQSVEVVPARWTGPGARGAPHLPGARRPRAATHNPPAVRQHVFPPILRRVGVATVEG